MIRARGERGRRRVDSSYLGRVKHWPVGDGRRESRGGPGRDARNRNRSFARKRREKTVRRVVIDGRRRVLTNEKLPVVKNSTPIELLPCAIGRGRYGSFARCTEKGNGDSKTAFAGDTHLGPERATTAETARTTAVKTAAAATSGVRCSATWSTAIRTGPLWRHDMTAVVRTGTRRRRRRHTESTRARTVLRITDDERAHGPERISLSSSRSE